MDASESATKQRQASGSALMIVRMVIMMMMMMTVNRMSVTIRIAGTRFEQGRRQGG